MYLIMTITSVRGKPTISNGTDKMIVLRRKDYFIFSVLLYNSYIFGRGGIVGVDDILS